MFGPEERDFFEKPTGLMITIHYKYLMVRQPRGQSVGSIS